MKKAKVKLHMTNQNIISALLSSPYFEVIPNKKVTKIIITGAVGVSEAADESITIKCHGRKIRICGPKVKMNILENNTLEIVGRIEEIKLNERA